MDVDSCYTDQCYNIKLDGATVNMLLSLFWTLRFSPLPLRSAMFTNGQLCIFFFHYAKAPCMFSFLTSSSTIERFIYLWDPVLFSLCTQICSQVGDEMQILSHFCHTDQSHLMSQDMLCVSTKRCNQPQKHQKLPLISTRLATQSYSTNFFFHNFQNSS